MYSMKASQNRNAAMEKTMKQNWKLNCSMRVPMPSNTVLAKSRTSQSRNPEGNITPLALEAIHGKQGVDDACSINSSINSVRS